MILANWNGNTACDLRILVDGDKVEVWRTASGGAEEFVLSATGMPVLDNKQIKFFATANTKVWFDDITVAAVDPEHTAFTYGDANQLTKLNVGIAPPVEYTYDAWGRLLTKTQEYCDVATQTTGSYQADYMYRYGSKLKRIDSTFPGETALVAYNYDGLGRRRVKEIGGNATWWRWGLGWNVLTQYDETNNVGWTVDGFSRFFVPKGHAALAEADVTTTPAAATYNYLGHDHLGTGRAVYDQAKAKSAAVEHLPYGKHLAQNGPASYHEFTGKPWDADSGFYYFPYRTYSPAMARWTGKDPLELVDGPNLYGYVQESPIRKYDKDGRFFLESLGPYAFTLPCLVYAGIRAAYGPQGLSTQHCVLGCQLAKCLGKRGGISVGLLALLINEVYEWHDGYEGDWIRDNYAAFQGAYSCSACLSCNECCQNKFPGHGRGNNPRPWEEYW